MSQAKPDHQARIAASFAKQTIMTTLGAQLDHVEAGMVRIVLPVAGHLSQQHGFVHAGVVSTIADSACGYAGLTTMEPGMGVLTIEFKVNLLAPASGERLIATGCVKKAGRSIVVAQADVESETDDKRKLVATMTATLMAIAGREGVCD